MVKKVVSVTTEIEPHEKNFRGFTNRIFTVFYNSKFHEKRKILYGLMVRFIEVWFHYSPLLGAFTL